MAIHFVCGKPGGGKTLYAVKLIIDEIVCGNRDIVTNVALKLGELNAYLQDKFPRAFERYVIGSGRTLVDRIRIIDEDELRTFYIFRGNGVSLPLVSVSGERDTVPDYKAAIDGGVFYVLDEIHIAFNARSWASTGKQVLYYLSQHRKMGDDVICITQAVGNVDKQFRSVAQDYTYVRNLSKARFGMFRFPGIFHRSTYPSVPTDATKAMVEATFTLDVSGIAAVYDTAKGVGIHGRSGADTKERKKGLPFWVLMVLLAALLWFAFFEVPKILQWYFSPDRILHKVKKVEAATVNPGVTVNTNGMFGDWHNFNPATLQSHSHEVQPASAAPFVSGSLSVPVVDYLGKSASDSNDVYCVGYCLLPGDEECYFSDGTTAYSRDGEIQEVKRNWVTAWHKQFRVIRGVVASPGQSQGAQRISSAVPLASVQPAPPTSSETYPGGLEVLPAIHGNYDGLERPETLNGLQGMRSGSPGGRQQSTY